MGIHDQMAFKAYCGGKSSQDFAIAAQRKANSIAVWALIGFVVWFFSGLTWSLLPFGLVLFEAIQMSSALELQKRVQAIEARVAANESGDQR